MPTRRVCLDHLTLPVTDRERSAAFCRAAAFVLDPDGHNVEAVFHEGRV